MTRDELVLLAAAAITTAAWLLAVGAIRALRQPREPRRLEPTLEVGPEPPALANFLGGNFRVTPDAVPATLLDLAARRVVEIERIDVDTYQCRLRKPPAEPLAPYEERVLRHLQTRARNGVVPAQALTTGAGDDSSRWWKAFVREVVDDAQRRGLSRDLWPRGLAVLFAAGALLPAALVGLAFGAEAFFVYAVLPVAVIGRVRSGRRQRDTPAGLEAAARWRAVQAKLGENEVFRQQPPITVALWERLLAYGAALGVAPAAVRALPMGAESMTRAWSAYGGRWHEVRVSYRTGGQWGVHPGSAALRRVALPAVCLLVLAIVGPAVADEIDKATGTELLVVAGAAGLVVALVAGGLVLALRAALDLFTTTEVTGEVVRLRIKRGEGNEPQGYFVAVDDGTRTRIRAWSVRPALYAGLRQGQIVTVRVTPRLGFVRSITAAGEHPVETAATGTPAGTA